MARETKTQRLERKQAERAAYEAEMAATYPQRLMDTLERATAENFEIYVRDKKFHVSNIDDRDDRFELTLNFGYDQENEDALNNLDWVIGIKESERHEANRKYQLKQQALGKLSKEEREVLGL